MRSQRSSLPVRFGARAIVLAAFGWCLFGENSLEELTAAVVFGVAASAALQWVRSRTVAAPQVPVRGVGIVARRVPRKVLADLWRLLVVLVRGHGARRAYYELPMQARRRSPDERGRRAVVLAGISVAPNTIALELDPHRGQVLVHQLAAAPQPTDPQWPL